MVFATDDQRPAGVTIPAISGPTIAVVDREAPARGKLLLVLGRTEAELKTAAKALGIGQNTLTGPSATITQLNELAPRAPYDAPNWLPTNRPVRFGELADARDLTVSGYDADAVRVNLRVPPDLFMWHTKGAPIDLRYRYTVRPLRDRSSLNVSVNDGFVQALPIPAESASVFELSHYFARVLPDKTAEARRTVHIPPLLLTPRAQVRLHFYYDIPNTGECHGRLLENVVGAIDPNSTIDLSSFPHYMALPDLAAFANSGFPFTRMADLSETAVILPNDADSSDYSLYLLTMGRMGASTGYPVNGVTVGTADDVDKYANKDLLIFGAPGKQPLLQRWAKSMPFSSDGDSRTFAALRHRLQARGLVAWRTRRRTLAGARRPDAREFERRCAPDRFRIAAAEEPQRRRAGERGRPVGRRSVRRPARRRRAAGDSRRDGRDPRPHRHHHVERRSVLCRPFVAAGVSALGAVVASAVADAGRRARRADHRGPVLPDAALDRRAPPKGLIGLICGFESTRHAWR